MNKLLQLQPNHADHISNYKEDYLNNMFEYEPVIAQPKYDGERMLIHIIGKQVFCTSRRFSKKTGQYTENQDKLKFLKDAIANIKYLFDYTVLDCECYANTWSEAVGVLHSLPDRAEELLKTVNLRFAVFDCLFWEGKDIRNIEYYKRLSIAKHVIDELNIENIHLVKFMNDNNMPADISEAATIENKAQWQTCMNNSIAAGFEGVVLKSLSRMYYDKAASLKCKKFETVDVVVHSYQNGRGKYENTIGALRVGYYDSTTNSIIHISQVNCSTDEERNYWRDNWNDLVGSVIEVKCQEVTEGSLRHPVYIRRRPDKNAKMCTKDTIFKEK